MPIRIVQSKQNVRLKELRKAIAHPGRNERGLVGIEGPNLIEEAVRARLSFRCIFLPDTRCNKIADSESLASQLADCETLLVPPAILMDVLDTETPQPVAALVEPPKWSWSSMRNSRANSAALIVILAGIQDPGNLGTILRSAEAFGASGVICLPGTVSAWNPKAVRASAGSVFRIPLLNVGEAEAFEELRKAGVRALTTAVERSKAADKADLVGPVAFLIGNEGNGVPAELAAKADGAVTIPYPGPVESLNAAVAASVLLYEAARQRALTRGSRPTRGGAC